MTDLMDYLFHHSHQRRIFTAFRPTHFFVHHRQRHNVQMVVINRLSVLFSHSDIQLISVHDCGNNIVFSIELFCKMERFFIESAGEIIAAVPLEIVCIHIQNHLVKDCCVCFQSL